MAKLEWRGRQAQQPAESPVQERLKMASGLDVLILESVDLVDDDQRELGPVRHERVARQIVEDCPRAFFVAFR